MTVTAVFFSSTSASAHASTCRIHVLYQGVSYERGTPVNGRCHGRLFQLDQRVGARLHLPCT